MAIGIDYSMTCPAACLWTPAGARFWYAHESKHHTDSNLDCLPITKDGLTTTERAARLARGLLDWIFLRDPSVSKVAIEDYAFAATGRVFHIGENTGVLKYFLESRNLSYDTIPPTVVKKFATGKGNADKIAMTWAFINAYPACRQWIPHFFPRSLDGDREPVKWAKSPLADLADAYWIARYSADK